MISKKLNTRGLLVATVIILSISLYVRTVSIGQILNVTINSIRYVLAVFFIVLTLVLKKAAFLLLMLSVFLLSGCWTTKSGQKSGIIVKVAKEGRYWGTYEGELIRGGLEDASGATGREFNFTLGQFYSDKIKQAESAMQNNSHVIIFYHCEEWTAPWRGETKCFLDDLKIVDVKNRKVESR